MEDRVAPHMHSPRAVSTRRLLIAIVLLSSACDSSGEPGGDGLRGC